MFARPDEKAAFEKVLGRVRQAIWGGDAYGAGLVAAGTLDLVVEADLEPYDVLPLVPVIEGAGGRVTNWEGRGPDLSSDQRMIVAGDPRIHAEALALLRAG
jgi:myo-inositol-1(or 4)-monophosphatase